MVSPPPFSPPPLFFFLISALHTRQTDPNVTKNTFNSPDKRLQKCLSVCTIQSFTRWRAVSKKRLKRDKLLLFFSFSRGDWKEFSNRSLFSRKQLGHYEGQTERSLTSSARSLQCVKTCKASTRAGEEDFDEVTLTSELSHGEQTWFPLYRKTTWVSEGSAGSFSPFLSPR